MIEREIDVPENTNLIINDTKISTDRVERAFRRLRSSFVDFVVFFASRRIYLNGGDTWKIYQKSLEYFF